MNFRKIKGIISVSLLMLFLLSIMLLFLVGCSANYHSNEIRKKDLLLYLENSIQNHDGQAGLIIRLEPQILSLNNMPDFIDMVITNYSEVAYGGGLHHTIQFYGGGGWIFIIPPPMFPDLGITIKSGTVFEMRSSLIAEIPNLATGKYRIKYGSLDEYWYAVFFVVD